MSLLDALKKAFTRPAPVTSRPATPAPTPEPIRVPEVTAAALMAALRDGNGKRPLLLDCREHFERRQGYLPDSTHIVMREIPYHLADLARDADIVVYCAHGNRSYDVAGWLIQQGFTARSLRGGIVDWQSRGGEVARTSAA